MLNACGFYACDGQQVIPIGNEKVNRFFFDNADEGILPLMSAAVDPAKKLIIWAYASNNSANVVKLTIEFGDADAADNIEVTIDAEAGLVLIIPGLILTGSEDIQAFAGTTAVITIHGYVNRIA